MIFTKKKKKAELRYGYSLRLQLGIISTLILLTILFRIPLSFQNDLVFLIVADEMVQIDEIIQTEQIETPPPPPRPPTPIEVPNDTIVEDDFIDLGFELLFDEPLPLPPPPTNNGEWEDEPEIFIVVERMPEPIGGMSAIYSRLVYPEIARLAGIEGRVIIQFIVDEEGNVIDPIVLRGIGGGADEAAIEAVRGVRFTPGLQRGRAVKVRYQMPIMFRLSSSN